MRARKRPRTRDSNDLTHGLSSYLKEIKRVEEQLKLEVTCIGEGTPGRLKALLGKALRFLLLNWNWRDQKPRMMVDIPDVQTDLLKLLDTGILKGCREGNTNTHPTISNWTSSALTQTHTPQLL
ncbi:protein CMSS1 isoform X2 [Oncorhynchus tshawytscha]|uniref:protein CMSS1 isoform X2 n=1 Tax=Oncorhynchus tshawytscha TaxID=74940 RepID=UPI000D099DB6|nr:protein CMSS1 isoform X2 [Oncorhynchus tshawytscha]